jgi:cell division protein ZapA
VGDVRLSICGRLYDVHCEDGQEAQLEKLAAVVEAKARTITGGTEVRQLLFAALMLADEAQDGQPKGDGTAAKQELAEAKARETQLLSVLAAAQASEKSALARIKALETAPASASGPSPAMTRALEQVADRIEALANRVASQA